MQVCLSSMQQVSNSTHYFARYEGRIGVAPASFLALLSSPVVCDSVTPTEMSMVRATFK